VRSTSRLNPRSYHLACRLSSSFPATRRPLRWRRSSTSSLTAPSGRRLQSAPVRDRADRAPLALPCWEHLPAEEYRERIHGLVEEVEEEAAADRERTGIPARGPEAILARIRSTVPRRSPSRPLPSCTPRPKPPAWRSTSPTPGSSRRSVKPPRSSDEGIATSASRPAASRRPYLLFPGRDGK